jgi:hypothetical protein
VSTDGKIGLNEEEKTRGSTVKIAPIDEKKDALQKPPVVTESRVGKKLSDLTTRRVIILVLSMLISVPIFDSGTYVDDDTSYDI